MKQTTHDGATCDLIVLAAHQAWVTVGALSPDGAGAALGASLLSPHKSSALLSGQVPCHPHATNESTKAHRKLAQGHWSPGRTPDRALRA